MEPSLSRALYTESIAAAVTPEMLDDIKRAASEAGMRPGEWLRIVAGNALKPDKGTRMVMAEVIALKEITLDFLYDLSDRLESELDAMVGKIDGRKVAMADAAIKEFEDKTNA